MGRDKATWSGCPWFCLAILFVGFGCPSADAASAEAATEHVPVTEGPQPGLDVNDVSVLFPHPETAERVTLLLGADSKLANGKDLWPAVEFKSLLDAAAVPSTEKVSVAPAAGGQSPVELPGPGIGVPGSNLRDRSQWRVVSFRFDPCAHAVDGGDCLVQVRMVVQPFLITGDSARERDVTAHLIYSFPTEFEPELIAALRRLKREETTGRPLGVHPVMAREGLEGAAASAAKAFLVNELKKGQLELAALMGLAEDPDPWVFVAGAFRNGAFIPLELDFGEERAASQQVGFSSGAEGRVRPKFAGLSTAALVDGSSRSMTVEDARVLAVVDSPVHSALLPGSQRSPRNRDCVSCHTTTSSLFKLTGGGRSAPDLARWLSATERFRPAEGVTGYPEPAALVTRGYSLRNFGYFGGRAAISIRTVNETAEAARLANEHAGLTNPSRLRCEEEKLWLCILGAAGQAGAWDACAAAHCGEG